VYVNHIHSSHTLSIGFKLHLDCTRFSSLLCALCYRGVRENQLRYIMRRSVEGGMDHEIVLRAWFGRIGFYDRGS
jgi:hypothetical protein